MTKTILMGASLLAILAAFPALADTTVKSDTTLSVKAQDKLDKAGAVIEENADKAGAKIEKAAEKTEAAAKNAYSDVKAYFTNDKDVKATSSVSVAERNTAEALIGTGVQNSEGKNVGKIHDIIVDNEGEAEWVIIEDGGVLGLGSKLAAFDYDVIEGYNKDKDVVVKLSEQSIKAATPFEYKASAKADAKVTTLPADKFSVKKILDAKVIGTDGKKIADVDTVAFDGDDAEFIIVTFDKVLGMGGDKAALNIDALALTKKDEDNYVFTLDSKQTAQFENYKETTKAN